jgi:hypothetical protein
MANKTTVRGSVLSSTPGFDVGRHILDHLYKAMSIDAEWSVRSETGFVWWAHNLAQRVWVERAPQADDLYSVCVRIETDFLCEVPDTEQTAAVVLSGNIHASLSSMVWDKQRRTVKLACAAYGNESCADFVARLLSLAMAIQCADAHQLAGVTAETIRAKVDVSHHPDSGWRREPDEMLTVLEQLVIPFGELPSPFCGDELARAAESIAAYCLITTSETGLTSEFPFWGSTPAVVRLSQFLSDPGTLEAHLRELAEAVAEQLTQDGESALPTDGCRNTGGNRWRPGGPETALFQINGAARHPLLGSGALLLLKLPIACDWQEGAEIARRLNCAEASQWTGHAQLGAWCWDPAISSPAFVCFVPSVAEIRYLLANLTNSMLRKAKWAHWFLTAE